MEAETFRCATCGNTALQESSDGALVCSRCGERYQLEEHLCPECGAANPPGQEECPVCGRTLDLVGFVLSSRLLPPADRLERIRQQAAVLKQEADSISQERLDRWWQEEQKRRRSVAEAQAEQQRRERKLLTVAAVVIAVVLVGLIVYLVLTAGGPGDAALTATPAP